MGIQIHMRLSMTKVVLQNISNTLKDRNLKEEIPVFSVR